MRTGYVLKGLSRADSWYYNWGGLTGTDIDVGVDLPILDNQSGIPTIDYKTLSTDLMIIPDGDNVQTNDVTISDITLGTYTREGTSECMHNVYATYVNRSTFRNITTRAASDTAWHSFITWSSTFENIFLNGLDSGKVGYPTTSGFGFGFGITSSGMTSNHFSSCGTFAIEQGWYISRGFYSVLDACFSETVPAGGTGFNIQTPFGMTFNACGAEYCGGMMFDIGTTTSGASCNINNWSATAVQISGETFKIDGAGLYVTIDNALINTEQVVNSIGTYNGCEVYVLGNIPFKSSSTGSDSPLNFGMKNRFYKHNRETSTLEFSGMGVSPYPFYVSNVAQFVMNVEFELSASIQNSTLASANQQLTISSNHFAISSFATLVAGGHGNLNTQFRGRVNKGDTLTLTMSPSTLTCPTGAGQVVSLNI